MNTVKLYQKNVYLKEFDAKITSARTDGKDIIITLDQTAFFPTGGGQSCDRGNISGFEVTDVYEENGHIFHRLKSGASKGELGEGDAVSGQIDWEHRFDNMQRHCGEHILSGMFFREYGGVNRGFHMGDEYMTIDISLEEKPEYKEVTWEMAQHVELCTNEAIWSNAPVITRHFDRREEAENLPLRKALAFDEDITIVCVGSTDNPSDCVACCGTHPSTAGQVGLVKLYKVEPNKGMFRIYFEAGKRALMDYDKKHNILTELGGRYSAGTDDLMDKIRIHEDKQKELRSDFFALRQTVIRNRAEEISDEVNDGSVHTYTFPEFKTDDLRNLAKHLDFAGCKLAVFCDEHTLTALVYSNGKVDCGKLIKDNAPVFGGKGGGRADNAQAKFDSIENMKLFTDSAEKILR